MQTRCLLRCDLALAAAFLTTPLCAAGSSLEGLIRPERWQSELATWAALMYAELPDSSKN